MSEKEQKIIICKNCGKANIPLVLSERVLQLLVNLLWSLDSQKIDRLVNDNDLSIDERKIADFL